MLKTIKSEVDSCGLQKIDLKSSLGKKLAIKLNISSDDKYAKDAARACQCGELEIYYAWTLSYVKKYCNACGAFELKSTKIKT